jgi:hypothetical protein
VTASIVLGACAVAGVIASFAFLGAAAIVGDIDRSLKCLQYYMVATCAFGAFGIVAMIADLLGF